MKVKIKTVDIIPHIYDRNNGWRGTNNLPEYFEFEAEEVKESDRTWFVNSRGEVSHTDHYHSEKHQQRVAFGNAFYSKANAEVKAKEMRDFLLSKPE